MRKEVLVKSLHEHNEAQREQYRRQQQGTQKTGVACERCGAELEFVGQALLMSDPPKRPVACPACGARGSLVV